ncbi:response regulator [Reinekea sp.]|jgi:DNA-binding response OmpR family regulator|uniref:response regulator n=1 Tax=Reinekea sp. TaxID=1970455 RepID=UPI00398A4344
MQKLNFLVVDDAAFIRDLVKRTLKKQFTQCHVDEAINGKKAQTLLTKNSYDLVLCDWEMPVLSGLELLVWFRQYEVEQEQSKTPFMMVTSRGDKTHVVEAVQAGVSDYIGKPFSSDQILKKVFKLLAVNHRDLVRSILKGTAAMGQAQGTGNESASVLMGAPAIEPKTNTVTSASVLTGGSPSSKLVDKIAARATKAKPSSLAKVSIRSAKGAWKGDLRDINLTDLSMVINFAESNPPTVLDQVVVDVVPKNDPEAVARINTIVTAIALTEKTIDCSIAHISVHIVDEDQDKLATLSKFIAQVRR